MVKAVPLFLVAPLLGGCAAFGAFERGYGDVFAHVEPRPREARQAEKLSMRELGAAPRGWREYEMGRRYEKGVGVDRDLDCAAYWYGLASASAYEQVDLNPAWGANPPTVTRAGMPWARVALRRIGRTTSAVSSSTVAPQGCREFEQ